jgi:hypothetical protein
LRGTSTRSGLGLLLVVLVAAGAGRAVAAPPDADSSAEPVRVEYDAPASCPVEEAFWAAVTARTPKVRRGEEGAPARTFAIKLVAGGDESTGHLVVRALDGSTSEREVAGDTCEEVVSALALVAALAVDPNATTKPLPLPAPPPRSPAPAPPRRPVAAAVVATPPPPQATPVVARTAVSAGGLVAVGAAPAPLVGASLAVAATRPRGGWLEPTVRLGVAAASTGTVSVAGGTASFSSLVGAIDGCPGGWTLGRWRLEPCLRLEAGVVGARGENVVQARTDTHPWAAAAAVGRVEWRFSRGFFGELAGGVRVPLVRTTFFFEPDTTLYHTSPVGAVFSAGLGLRFL